MSDPALFVFTPGVLLGMALVAIGLAVGCVWLIARNMVQSTECDCVPTILRNQSGGFSSRIFHSRLCRFHKEKGKIE